MISINFQQRSSFYTEFMISKYEMINIYLFEAEMRNLEKLRNNIYTHFGNQLAKNHIVNVIGYGSGVFPQTKNAQAIARNTIDMIVTVKDSNVFHQKNVRKNPLDYEGMSGLVGTDYLNYLNKYVFPVHFNHIKLGQDQIKYGVVNQSLFLKDLIDWNILTLGGRMHKPVQPLIPLDQETQRTIYGNRRYALNVALLLMIKQQRIPIIDLYMKISEISYMGDIRFVASVQNINKVRNIVVNNLERFNQIYFPLIRQLESHAGDTFKFNGYDYVQMKLQPKLIGILLSKGAFPRQLYFNLSDKFEKQGFKGGLAQQFLLLGIPEIKTELQRQIRSINRSSSMKMAGNVFLGGGLLTNFNYLIKKFGKKDIK